MLNCRAYYGCASPFLRRSMARMALQRSFGTRCFLPLRTCYFNSVKLFAGIGACSREGILVKGGNYLEALAKADTGVFDKTGTLTNGKFEFVTCEHNHCHCKDNKHRELLKIIAACERYSTHPIAKALMLHSVTMQTNVTLRIQNLCRARCFGSS